MALRKKDQAEPVTAVLLGVLDKLERGISEEWGGGPAPVAPPSCHVWPARRNEKSYDGNDVSSVAQAIWPRL
jgi:hypothetical protein